MSEGAPQLPDFSELPPLRPSTSLLAECWIAWDHLRPKRTSVLTNVTTLISILAVIISVGVLNNVMAVMAGFEIDLREKILGANAHALVLRHGGPIVEAPAKCDKIAELENVVAAAPFVYSEMMMRGQFGHTGVVMKGVDPERTGSVTHLRDDLVRGMGGDLDTLEQRQATFDMIAAGIPPLNPELEEDVSLLPGIFVGLDLSEQLMLRPGDKVQLINPVGTGPSLLGTPTPTVKSFRVAGIFDSGMFEYNTKWTYVNNADAQSFLKVGESWRAIEIKVDDIHRVEETVEAVDKLLGYPHYTQHWKELNDKLFAALRLEKIVMGAILSMTVLVASMLIISTLIMVVLTKIREIAILKAMGASGFSILRVFVLEGSVIGFVGVVIGTVVGLCGCYGLEAYGWPLETDVYYLSTLPVEVLPENVVTISVGAFAACVLSTFIPAGIAAGLDPVKGLRVE